MLGFAVGSDQSSLEKTSCWHGKEKGTDEGRALGPHRDVSIKQCQSRLHLWCFSGPVGPARAACGGLCGEATQFIELKPAWLLIIVHVHTLKHFCYLV